MRDVAGIILAEENDFGELTSVRSAAALPIAGRYRLIDFVLSGMVNSGMIHVGVVTCYKYSSLMEHLGSGKEWNLHRRGDGLFVLPPYVNRKDYDCFSGDIDMMVGALVHLKKCRHRYILVSKSNIVCNINFEKAFEMHCNTKADITLIYNEEDSVNNGESFTSVCTEGNEIRSVAYGVPKNGAGKLLMDMFIIERDLLIELIEEYASKGKHNFVRDILLPNEKNLKISGYRFEGYVGRVTGIESYYKNNMSVLNGEVKRELFERDDLIYSESCCRAPTRYGENATVKNTLAADGCIIEGMTDGCILSGGVHIGKRAYVKNSIIMENTYIEEGCTVKNAIIDKDCIIRRGSELTGHQLRPIIVPKGMIL